MTKQDTRCSVNETNSVLSYPVPPGTKVVFFDGQPGHHYLYYLYSEINQSSLVIAENRHWNDPSRKGVKFLENSLNEGVASVVYLTLDPYLYAAGFDRFLSQTHEMAARINIFGILHKLPEYGWQVDRIRKLSPYITFIALEKNMTDEIARLVRGNNCEYLPLHPELGDFLISREDAKESLGLPNDRIIISLLGELRDGKGLDKLTNSLAFLSRDFKKYVCFAICGKSTQVDPDSIASCFAQHGVQLRLVSGNNSPDYRLLPDSLMAKYISASDIGILFYEGPQRACMSGVLPNYVASNTWLVASKDSIVGDVVEANALGRCVDITLPDNVASGLMSALSDVIEGDINVSAGKFAMSIQKASVINRLDQILNQAD